MAYATYTDVASEFKGISFSSTSPVTDTEVTEFISQAEAYLDGRVGVKYVTPITGAESLKIMKRLSIWLVAARVKDIFTVKLGQQVGEQEALQGDRKQMAEDELKMIVNGTLLLSDATLVSAKDGVNAFSIDEGLEFEFTATGDNW